MVLTRSTASRLVLLLPVVFAAAAGPAPARAGGVTDYAVDGHFSDENEAATNLSGIACMPSEGVAPRRCLVIDDEEKFAQWATIDDQQHRITPGSRVPLIGGDPPEAAVGTRPDASCPDGPGGFKEFDGEAVAYAAPYFYVAGSHGCSRNSGKFRLSSFLLARVSPQDGGAATVDLTWRLGEALQDVAEVRPYFGKALTEANGLNIEGMAVIGDTLYAGLRAPSLEGSAYLISVSLDALFAPGDLSAKPVPLALGPNAGIRDLAALPDGRLLVLSGPAQEQPDVPASLFVAKPLSAGSLQRLDIQIGVAGAKAEAAAIRDAGGGRLNVLVLYDGLPDGGPRTVDILPSE